MIVVDDVDVSIATVDPTAPLRGPGVGPRTPTRGARAAAWLLELLQMPSHTSSGGDRAQLPAALLSAAEHDVRSLLTTIHMGAETLRTHVSDDQLRDVADAVSRASHQLSQVLTQLVETAGAVLHTGAPTTPVDVTATVDQILQAYGVAPATVIPNLRLHVIANDVLLRHLITNLVANAVTAAGAQAVSVEISATTDTSVDVTIHNPALQRLRPIDRPPDDVLHLGAGRGLAIATIIAEAAGIQYTAHHRDEQYVAHLSIPDRVRHPTLQEPDLTDAPSHVTNIRPHQDPPTP